jgi:hypothetical protein
MSPGTPRDCEVVAYANFWGCIPGFCYCHSPTPTIIRASRSNQQSMPACVDISDRGPPYSLKQTVNAKKVKTFLAGFWLLLSH